MQRYFWTQLAAWVVHVHIGEDLGHRRLGEDMDFTMGVYPFDFYPLRLLAVEIAPRSFALRPVARGTPCTTYN